MQYVWAMNILRLLPITFFFGALSGACAALAQTANFSPAEKMNQTHASTLLPFMELYTSQACPRCPAGNTAFAEFAVKTDAIAITFSVDYWDFMGWQDTFAQRSFSERQKKLNTQLGRRGPYTPQVIFNGEEHCSALKEKYMTKKLADTTHSPDLFSVAYNGKEIEVSKNETALEVWVIEYEAGNTFDTPKSGQNNNKTMIYYNRATGIQSAGIVNPNGGKLSANCEKSCAVVFQETNLGHVLGAITIPNGPELHIR